MQHLGVHLSQTAYLFSDILSALHMTINSIFMISLSTLSLNITLVREKVGLGNLDGILSLNQTTSQTALWRISRQRES